MESDLQNGPYGVDATVIDRQMYDEAMAAAHINIMTAHVVEDEIKKRKRRGEEEEDDEHELNEGSSGAEEIASGGPIPDIMMNPEDKTSLIRKQAINWIKKTFEHNHTPNYTGVSKDFVFQLYNHSFATETPLMSVPQFTRLFNEVMYKELEFNPRARKTPSNQVIGELFPLLGVSLDIVEKTFGHKDKRITYFPKISLAPHIKDLKDALVTGIWDQQRFLESLRTYKRLTTESKENRKPTKRILDNNNSANAANLSDHRIYLSEKFMVVALDIPGVDPNEIEISFPSDRSIRVVHKDSTKTYEETQLLEQVSFQLVGGSLRRGNILSVPREIQLPESIEVPHPSNTSSPFIHDHYGTVLFKFLRKFQPEVEPYLKAYIWSKEPLKFE